MKVLQKIRKQCQRIKLNKYSLLALLIGMGMSMTYPISVSADNEASFQAALANLTSKASDPSYVRGMQLLIQVGRERGLSDTSIAGIMNNTVYEGNWNSVEDCNSSVKDVNTGAMGVSPKAGGTYDSDYKPTTAYPTHGQGVGIIQWTPGDTKICAACDTVCSKAGCSYFTISRWVANVTSVTTSNCRAAIEAGNIAKKTIKVPEVEGQIYYLLNMDSGNGFADAGSISQINACTTAEAASYWFTVNKERPNNKEATGVARQATANKALAAVKAFDGVVLPHEDIEIIGEEEEETPTTGDLDEVERDIQLDTMYESMYEDGLITEDQLGAYYKLTEKNMHLDELTRDTFGATFDEEGNKIDGEAEKYSENLRQLNQWEDNIEGEKITLVKVLRWICMFIGILMIMWVLLMYIAYWFDKINTIVPFSVMAIVSFGHYVVADNEDSSDVNMMNPEKTGKMKQINHKGILLICLLTLIVASFLISGVLFNWMRYGILWVQQQLSKLTLG